MNDALRWDGECEPFPFVGREHERPPTCVLHEHTIYNTLPRDGSVAAKGLPLLVTDEHQSVWHSVAVPVELFSTEVVLRGAEQQPPPP